ncbi:hypothetical protein RN001_013204 [Aquatica leii]|uniref:PH domain-containing protein n=1 Tax=Aquatica leii TaxID=1421715 RepID=A0AAN7PQB0_9COLE|nr:hypothetical protein RN001_013204 [Aquatica leii]
MAVLLENVTNYVWHAFAALQQDKPGFVQKSKLKVLTANIGTLLDLYGVEKGLDHYRSTSSLNFDHFKYYLQREVFSSLPDKIPLPELRDHETKIAEACWFVCQKRYLSQEKRIFSDESVLQIFRIFCLLAELILDKNGVTYQVLLHPSEASYVAQTLANSLGCIWDEEDFIDLGVSIGAFRLAPFIAVLESRCVVDVKDPDAISEAVTDLYQTFVDDVIKKGFLYKKGYIFSTMKEYWFVLRPSELAYYKSRSEKERCGSLTIEPGSKVESKAGFKILLQTPERTFELGTSDHMTRLQWISALQVAADHSATFQTYQRMQASKRRMQRQGRSQEILRARAQLQHERNARKAAEGQAKELEAVVIEESKRLTELEQIRSNLEKLLEEETQAKRDEEIVRALQARVLAEEWEKREELEKLQEEQRTLLDEERGKRKEYEELQFKKEMDLKAAQDRLDQLDRERIGLDDALKLAIHKIQLSEERREILESRLLEVAPSLRDGDRIRRARSFVPSTKEKPILLEVRASTLRRPAKN